MNWQHRLKGSFYTLFFILLNIVYLIVELSFNARILDVSAAFSPATDFGQLELYGRSISASGATLFAWRLFISPHSKSGFFRVWMRFFVIALVVFPTVFIGQKKLVDSLVDQSSAETRRSAEILGLLKFGVANDFVEIEALSLDEWVLESAEGKMFITLSGLLAYNSHNVRAILESELDKITRYAIQTQKMQAAHRLYRNYLYASEKILEQFSRYQQLVAKLEQQQAGVYAQAVELYQAAMNHALKKWQVYQQLLQQRPNIDQVSSRQVSAMQYLLMTGQQRFNRCADDVCRQQARQHIDKRLAQNLGFFSQLSQWCKAQSLPQQSAVILQCLKQAKPVEQKIRRLRHLALALEAGLSQTYATRLDYLTSTEWRSRVFAVLHQKGVTTRAEWSFERYEDLLEDIRQQLDQHCIKAYDDAVLEHFGSSVKPRTELPEFAMIERMQNYYAQALGNFYRGPVSFNLTFDEFDQRYVAPAFAMRYQVLLNKLQADVNWYQDGAPYEASGKKSLRSLVIPAVAIAFSLTFGLLNAISLLLNFMFLLIEEKFWLRWSAFAVLLSLVLVMPLRHDYRIYSQPAYQDLLLETQKQDGIWAMVMDWVAKTEPLVYPLGNILRYNLLDGFSFD